MFDASAGAAAYTTQIDDLSNKFAANFAAFMADPTKTHDEKLRLMERFGAIMESSDDAKALAAGTYSQATASDGSPARALGSGSTGSDPYREALQTLLTAPDTEVPNDRKQLLRRALTVGDPDYIQVDAHGTPVRITQLEGQVHNLTTERDGIKKQLADERDDTVAGSLAKRLKDAAAGTVPLPAADSVKKSDVQAVVTKLQSLDNVRASGLRDRDAVVPGTPVATIKGAYGDLKRLAS